MGETFIEDNFPGVIFLGGNFLGGDFQGEYFQRGKIS